jgi:NitT/TauT family transport system ATP-binding protein
MSLEALQVSKTFSSNGQGIIALQEISFTISDGEFVCIVGPSGCGKTTLLRLIAGLTRPSAGTIHLTGSPSSQHPETAMVFQDHGLFPWMNALENIAFGLEMQGVPRPERLAAAQTFIKKMQLEGFEKSYPHQLSGGMRQRVGIARAFLADPDILLMDEPFGALDAQTKLVMEEELLRIWSEQQKTILYVTHDIEEAILLGDRILVMGGHPGHIKQEIQVPLQRPRHISDRDSNIAKDIRWQVWNLLEKEVRQEEGLS